MSIDDMFKKEEKKLRKLFDTKLLSELLLLNYQYSNNEYLGTTAEDVYNSLSKKIKYTKKEKEQIVIWTPFLGQNRNEVFICLN